MPVGPDLPTSYSYGYSRRGDIKFIARTYVSLSMRRVGEKVTVGAAAKFARQWIRCAAGTRSKNFFNYTLSAFTSS